MNDLWKALLALILAPVIIGVALNAIAAFLWSVVPILILVGVVAGLAAGVTAALILRRRLPPRNGAAVLPPGTPSLGGHRVKRSRGGWRS